MELERSRRVWRTEIDEIKFSRPHFKMEYDETVNKMLVQISFGLNFPIMVESI